MWARFFSPKERDWVLKKLVGLKYTLDGSIIVPEVVRYGEPKAGPKVSSYQVSKAVTSSTDILIELANHIIKNDRTLPGFQVFELLCCEIPVRSLIIKFATPPPSLGRKVSLANRPITHLTNSKCILCKSVDHTLWDCPLPPAQVSTGYSLGPTLYEFKDGETWDPKSVEGLEEVQLDRQRAQANQHEGPSYSSSEDSDNDIDQDEDEKSGPKPKDKYCAKAGWKKQEQKTFCEVSRPK